MTLNDASSALSLLESRRSGRPRDLVEPGPTDEQLMRMLGIASRTPDHGQIVPYRFVVVAKDHREALAGLYRRAMAACDRDAPQTKIDKAMVNARAAPCLVILIAAPVRDHKIPVFEQELTCGAAGMNLLHAATAMGFAGGWVTGWPAVDPMVIDEFCRPGERIAGLIYLGTPSIPLEERIRPRLDSIVTKWSPRTQD
jgi:nitroreductase